MRPFSTLTASCCAILALGVWGTYGYAVFDISERSAAYIAGQADAQQSAVIGENKIKMHAFVRETGAVREAIRKAASVDVVTIVRALRTAAADAAISIQVGDATTPAAQGERAALVPVSIAVSSDGSYARLARFTALVETLPVPVRIESLALSRDERDFTIWHLSMRIDALTTSPSQASQHPSL